MVYCTKCGTLNSVDAKVCSKCGASIQTPPEAATPYWRHSHYNKEYHYQKRGTGTGALIFGIIIVIIGLSMLFPEVSSKIPWWPIIFILIGFWLIAAALRRRSRDRQTQE